MKSFVGGPCRRQRVADGERTGADGGSSFVCPEGWCRSWDEAGLGSTRPHSCKDLSFNKATRCQGCVPWKRCGVWVDLQGWGNVVLLVVVKACNLGMESNRDR